MGRLVKLWKSHETADSVEYNYGEKRDCAGRLTIAKTTGVVTLLERVPGMSKEDSWFFFGMLAKAKAEKMFREHKYADEAHQAT